MGTLQFRGNPGGHGGDPQTLIIEVQPKLGGGKWQRGFQGEKE